MRYVQIDRPVILNTLRGVGGAGLSNRSAELSERRRKLLAEAEELKAVRDAMADGRSIEEQTIDGVIERLQRELSW